MITLSLTKDEKFLLVDQCLNRKDFSRREFKTNFLFEHF